jgi:dephospho-CoA kinase
VLRVGLTGELGSGKSTVAAMLAARGATVFSSDEIARELMQPGQPVFAAVLEHFGSTVLTLDHTLDRRKLAELAFDQAHPRIDELNALVHPAVIAEQAKRLGALAEEHPDAIVVIESALILSTPYGGDGRFDRILLVTAPEEHKIARYVARVARGRVLSEEERKALEADARRRMAAQQGEAPPGCIVIRNDGDLEQLAKQAEQAWFDLKTEGLETRNSNVPDGGYTG